MTKASARLRAKAAEKAKKRATGVGQKDKQVPSDRFDSGNKSIKSPMVNANSKGSGPARRGSARSR